MPWCPSLPFFLTPVVAQTARNNVESLMIDLSRKNNRVVPAHSPRKLLKKVTNNTVAEEKW